MIVRCVHVCCAIQREGQTKRKLVTVQRFFNWPGRESNTKNQRSVTTATELLLYRAGDSGDDMATVTARRRYVAWTRVAGYCNSDDESQVECCPRARDTCRSERLSLVVMSCRYQRVWLCVVVCGCHT